MISEGGCDIGVMAFTVLIYQKASSHLYVYHENNTFSFPSF